MFVCKLRTPGLESSCFPHCTASPTLWFIVELRKEMLLFGCVFWVTESITTALFQQIFLKLSKTTRLISCSNEQVLSELYFYLCEGFVST